MTGSYGVYPRACGGATVADSEDAAEKGLSPRMRGSPGVIEAVGIRNGSIPAHAGEPHRRGILNCGIRHWGLSPRMRGSLLWVLTAHLLKLQGSIPAHAGEPGSGLDITSVKEVYPRACGGAMLTGSSQGQDEGLSPRMRGSLEQG